jgi:hypothetical protein
VQGVTSGKFWYASDIVDGHDLPDAVGKGGLVTGDGVGGFLLFVGAGVRGRGGGVGGGGVGEGVGLSDDVVGPMFIGGDVTKSSSTRLMLSSDTLLPSTQARFALAPRLLTPHIHSG